ncbi:MAG: M48 family metallopeptidase [Oligoflexus sp.]
MVKFLVVLILSILNFSCVTSPDSERRQFIVVPNWKVQELGLQAYQEILQSEPLSKDQRLIAEVEKIGQAIAAASGQDFPWEFKVLANDEMVNAFCLPGGKVGVYTGIIKVAENTAGLAAVIGHEVAHATLRHGAERMSQALASQAGLTLASISMADSKYRGAILAALGLGVQVGLTLPYSRLHEQEADEVGSKYMAKAGYDPREAIALWQRMAQLSKSASPEFLSTHPHPASRVENLQKKMPELMPIYNSSQRQATRPL